MGGVQKHVCNVLGVSEEAREDVRGLVGKIRGGHFCDGQPLWRNVSSLQVRSHSELGSGGGGVCPKCL